MKLFYSPNSPYARIARIAAIESGVAAAIEYVQVRNRAPDSPLLQYSPVCRVPTLVSGELVLGEAKNICRYFEALTGVARFSSPADDWPSAGFESMTIGFLDGVAVWVRERRREGCEQSHLLLRVEEQRAERCLNYFERRLDDGLPPWNFAGIALACALEIMEFNHLLEGWSDNRPRLERWLNARTKQASMLETRPVRAEAAFPAASS